MTDHKIASYGEWFEAHRAHVEKEKAFTRQRERLARSGAACRGCGSTSLTSSTRQRDDNRSLTCSAAAAS